MGIACGFVFQNLNFTLIFRFHSIVNIVTHISSFKRNEEENRGLCLIHFISY